MVLFQGHKTYTASVGAAMAYVVGQDMWLDPLTVSHTPYNEEEADRVTANGGEIETAAVEARARRE